MDDDETMPLIFGCPFYATSRAKIYVEEGKLTLRVGKEKVTFNNFKPTHYLKKNNAMKMRSILKNWWTKE